MDDQNDRKGTDSANVVRKMRRLGVVTGKKIEVTKKFQKLKIYRSGRSIASRQPWLEALCVDYTGFTSLIQVGPFNAFVLTVVTFV